jgi:hypothetical protein
MKALVIHVSDVALPPSSRPMAGVETAPPEKDSGRTIAARQTEARMSGLPRTLAWRLVFVMECTE